MEPLRVGTCLREGWRLFGRRRSFLVGTSLFVALIEGIAALPIGLSPTSGFLLCATAPVLVALGLPLYVGLQHLVLLIARGRPHRFGDALAGFGCFGRLLGVALMVGLRAVVGLLPLVAAFVVWSLAQVAAPVGLYVVFGLGKAISCVLVLRVTLRYAYAGILVLEDQTGVFDSMRSSAEVTHGALWPLFGVGFLLGLLNAPAVMVGELWPGSLWASLLSWGLSLVYAILVVPWYVSSIMVAYRTLRRERQETGLTASGEAV